VQFQYRQISDEAVRAIVCENVLLQFSQNSSSQVASYLTDESARPSTSITMSNHPYFSPDLNLITASSDNRFLELMSISLNNFDLLLDRIRFEELRKEWLETRNTISSIVGDISRNPAYYKIVGMGPKVIPFILEHLSEETKTGMPDHWFAALWAISGGEDPVPDADQGRIRKMAEAWLRWGEQRGYLNAESVGTAVS